MAKQPDNPVTIKKYANRRLYNTGTSTYVTLEDLAGMVKEGEDFLVFDAKIHCDVTNHLSASLGVDNLNDRVYFLFHPFPQRTVVADLHLKL